MFCEVFECRLCQKTSQFRNDCDRVYNVPGWVPVIPRPAWCWSCNDLVQAEWIPTPEGILADARAHLRRDLDHAYLYRSHYRWSTWDDEEDLDLYDNALRWRQWRRSRGHCLDCASDMVSFAKDPRRRPFEHPGCGGFFHWMGLTSAIKEYRELYSSEGFLLQRDWTYGSCEHFVSARDLRVC